MLVILVQAARIEVELVELVDPPVEKTNKTKDGKETVLILTC